MRFLFILAAVCITACFTTCFSSCSHQYSDFFPYHDDGTMKPNVCVLPVIDDSNSGLSWNLSAEFTDKIRHQLMLDGRLFVPSKEKILKQLSLAKEENLAATMNLEPFLAFQPAHFVVVMELVEHRIVPYKRGTISPLYYANIPADEADVLMMKVRLRVVDIRGGQPHLVRQELIESNHVVSKQAVEEALAKRGTPAFASTAIAGAHIRLTKDIVKKIEQLTCFRK